MSKDGLQLTAKEIAAAFSDPEWAKRFPPILTVAEAAELIRLPEQTIYSWSSRGLLKGCSQKVGRYRRFFRDRYVAQLFNEGIHG